MKSRNKIELIFQIRIDTVVGEFCAFHIESN